jgi:hypothetical protein
MVESRSISLFSILILCLIAFSATATASQNPSNRTLKAVADLSLPFIENKGQIADPHVAYVADTFACRVAVTRNGQMIYSLPDHKECDSQIAITEHLVGATIDVQGKDKQDTKVSYFPGRDPTGWHSNLPCFAQVGLGRVGKGIRVELKAHGRNVEKLFYIKPGADPADIRIAVKGAQHLQVGPGGELELATTAGTMRFTKPVAYQQINGKRHKVSVQYNVNENTYGFELGAYDASKELVVDPLLTVFPVASSETHNFIMDLAAAPDGSIYAAGVANSKLSILKLDSRLEKLLASTYFSDNGRFFVDIIRCLALDRDGNVFVAGTTKNSDFPTTDGCYDDSICKPGPYPVVYKEGFVTKFSPDLDERLASTFIGGDHNDEIFAMVLDTRGRVYIAGYSERSSSSDDVLFPVVDGCYDTTQPPQDRKKAVVARLDKDLTTVQAATFLGGSEFSNGLYQNEDIAYCLAMDGDNIWVAGRTHQPDFPVTQGSFDQTYNGGGDVFLSKLDKDLKELLLSTYIGGSQIEAPTDMLLDKQSNIYLLGWTFSHDFPMPATGYKPSHSQEEDDGFVLKLNADASEILAGTFIGGTYDGSGHGDDVPAAMALSADNSVLRVVGRTESENFPITPDCFDSIIDDDGTPNDIAGANLDRHDPRNGDEEANDYGDGFYTVFNSVLTDLVYSTYIGGRSCEYLDAILINGDDIIIAGETTSLGFPGISTDDVHQSSRGVLLRFRDETDEAPPGGSDNNPVDSSSGGGGGGCFVQVLRR